jgi:signal transduction histidine kinase
LSFIAFVVFSLIAFEIKLGRVGKAAFVVTLSLPVISLLLIPAPMSRFILYLYFVPVVAVFVLAIKNLTLERVCNRPYLGLYLATIIFFVFWRPAAIAAHTYFFAAPVSSNTMLMLSQLAMLSQDYTEARRRAKELEEENLVLDSLSEMKSHFWANMNHELRSPLMLIASGVGVIELLLKEKAGDKREEIFDTLGSVKVEVERISRMAKETMELANLQGESFSMKKLDLGKLFRHTAKLYTKLLSTRENRLVFDIAENLPPVLGNADKLTQVLVNLLTNANTHTENGEITVKIFSASDMVTTEISDTGIGIAPELLADIFERHVKGELSSGAGMGLFISRAIVESHGGSIQLSSEPEKGTRASFSVSALRQTSDGDR